LTRFGGLSSLVCEPNFLASVSRGHPSFGRVGWKDSMADNPDLLPDAALADTKARLSRREFARRAALASAASIVPIPAVTPTPIDRESGTQDPQAPAAPAAVTKQNVLPNAPKLSAESQSEADARFQSILVLYGSRFSNEQKNDLHRLCAVVQPALDHIRAYKIENGDGTALYLKPQYEREKKPKATPSKPGQGAGSTKAAPSGGPKT
jgi:hypothetical protein